MIKLQIQHKNFSKREIVKYTFVMIALIISIHSTVSYGETVDIKGLHLGMKKEEIINKFGPLPLKEFTIGGVQSMFDLNFYDDFYENKLDRFIFFFEADSFNEVLQAVKLKYPALKCVDSTVSNAMGASFKQTICELQDQLGTLTLKRFVSDISTSVLNLSSHRRNQELANKQKMKQNDL